MRTGLKKRLVTFRINEGVWGEFVKAAHQRGLSASEVLRRFVSDYVRGEGK